jgi:hypothetical protein
MRIAKKPEDLVKLAVAMVLLPMEKAQTEEEEEEGRREAIGYYTVCAVVISVMMRCILQGLWRHYAQPHREQEEGAYEGRRRDSKEEIEL